MPFDSTEKWTVRRRSQAWPGLETNLEVLNMVSKFLGAVNSQTIFIVMCIISSEPVRLAGVNRAFPYVQRGEVACSVTFG